MASQTRPRDRIRGKDILTKKILCQGEGKKQDCTPGKVLVTLRRYLRVFRKEEKKGDNKGGRKAFQTTRKEKLRQCIGDIGGTPLVERMARKMALGWTKKKG